MQAPPRQRLLGHPCPVICLSAACILLHRPDPAQGRPLCLYRAADGAPDTCKSGTVTDRPVRIRSQYWSRDAAGGWAAPSRDSCTVLFLTAQPTSNSMTRRCVSLASIIGPGTVATRRAAGRPWTLVLAMWPATAAVRRASPRCPPGGGGTQRPATADRAAGGPGPSACTTPEAAVAITERPQPPE